MIEPIGLAKGLLDHLEAISSLSENRVSFSALMMRYDQPIDESAAGISVLCELMRLGNGE
jgi:hypothetical protein